MFRFLNGIGMAALAAGLGATDALANPEGGVVSAGQAQITTTGSKLDVYQTSGKAVIDWRSFDIGTTEHTEFHQPNAQALTVNRVNDTKASHIDGRLTANGNIVIINQNGVVFGSSAQVDVGGLTATTADITNDDAMNGRMNFSQSGSASGKIINEGRITVRDEGLVNLVAPEVQNHGIIQAKLGKVNLGSGETFTVDMAGDGMIKVAVSSDSLVGQKVVNTGTIQADGGTVTMTAAAARSLVDNLVVNKGTIRANAVGAKKGKVVLQAEGSNKTAKSGNSVALNEGTITAQGGDVEILGDHVGAMANSKIDVSSDTGGGTVKLGGDYQGQGSTQTAKVTYVDETATIDASAKTSGDGGKVIVWADDTTRYYGDIFAEGGSESGDGGFVEVSGKGYLTFAGRVSTRAENGASGNLLLDPTNIVISSAADSNVNGATPFAPTGDDVASNLSVATLVAALGSGNVTVQTRATGSQAGNITVSNAVTWGANTLTLDAHNNIVVNAALNGPNLTFTLDGDLQLNAAVTGTGTVTIQGKSNATTIGIAGGAGTINLSTADLANITNGWGNIVIGSYNGTGAIAVNAYTWLDYLNLRSDSGAISINGAQTMGANNLTIATNADPVIAATLTGTGAFRLDTTGSSTTMGLGGAAGTVNLSLAELANLVDGWSSLIFTTSNGTGDMTLNAINWNDPLTLQTATGVITVNGTQFTGNNNLTINTDADPVINAALSGWTSFRIQPRTPTTTMGLGGAAGTINLSAAEMAWISNGWANLYFGNITNTAAINVNALTWNDNTTIQTDSGLISINGNQTSGSNNFTLYSNVDIALNATLSGTGTFMVQKPGAGSFAIGDGASGAVSFTNAELDRILDGWSLIHFISGNADVRAYTWRDNVRFESYGGVITINGAQNLGANNLTIASDSNPVINAALTGTGTLTLRHGNTAATTIGIGGGAGTFNIDATELTRITNGWSDIKIGDTTGTGAITVNAATWNDNLTLQSNTGVITIAGAQAMGANNLTITTDANLALNAALGGTGTLTISGSAIATTMGLGGAAGTLNIDATELGRITDGWSWIYMGRTDGTGTITANAATWYDTIVFQSGTGVITVNGAQNFGNNLAVFSTDTDIALNSTLSGTGSLYFRSNLNGTSMGLAGAAGTINLTTAELNQIQNGFALLHFGTASGTTMGITANAYTWQDHVVFRSNAGTTTISGAQSFGANNFTLLTSVDPVINAALTGTGILSFQGSLDATTFGLGGAAGSFNLDTAELGRITDGWTDIFIGTTTGTGAITANAATWNDRLTMQSLTGVITIAGTQNFGGNRFYLYSDADSLINADLIGTGFFTTDTISSNISMGIGTGQSGTVLFTDAEIFRLVNGWGNLAFSIRGSSAVMNVGSYSWVDPLTLYAGYGSGTININGAQYMSSNDLAINADGEVAINAALSGNGILTIKGYNAATTIGVAGGAGTLNLSTADLSNINDGWSSIVIGASTATGAITLNSASWLDPLTVMSNTGLINFAGAQSMAGNKLTIDTSNLTIGAALSGTGTIEFRTAGTTTVGLGTGATGTLNLDDTELNFIQDGWNLISFGGGNNPISQAIDLRARTWNDNLSFYGGAGGININGTQAMGSNNLSFVLNALNIAAPITGTGSIDIKTYGNTVTVGVGDGATGTLNLTNAELDNFGSTHSQVTIGNNWTGSGSGAMDVRAYTWDENISFYNTGVININGDQVVSGGKNLSITTDANPVINGNLSGTGIITFKSQNDTAHIGVAGAAGAINIDAAETARILNGWSEIVFGNSTSAGNVTLNAYTWQDNLRLSASSGGAIINGAQNFGANTLTVVAGSIAVNAALTGTGDLVLYPFSQTGTIGLAGGAGVFNLDSTELDYITDGWSNIYIGRPVNGLSTMTANAYTWRDNVTLRTNSGLLNIAGTQTMGANNLTLITQNLTIGAALTGTGTLSMTSAGGSIGVGGAAGTLMIDATELGYLTNGWNSIVIGDTALASSMAVTAATWNDNLTLQSGTGVITITGAQNLGANNLTISSDSNPVIGAALTGTGIITLQGSSAATSIGVAGAAGTFNLSSAELANITNGWSSIVIGSQSMSGALAVNAASWNDNLLLWSDLGIITIAGAQTMGANNLAIRTSSDLALNAALTGTGAFTLMPNYTPTTLGLGDGQTGNVTLSNAELANLTDGWASLVFGAYYIDGAINVGAYSWLDPVTFYTRAGSININGTQSMGANNLTFSTDADPVIGAALTGTGSLVFQGTGAATTIGLAGGAGTLNLSTAELANITNGWSGITIGSTGSTGALTANTATWNDNLTLLNNAGTITIAGAQTMGANNLTIQTSVDPAINAALTGTGTLYILGVATGTTIGLAGGAGALNLSTADLANITNGWGNIVIGSTSGTGTITANAATWNDNLTLQSATGAITVAGAQAMGSNNLTISSDANPVINAALSGTGTLTLQGNSAGTTMGFGGGAGTFNLDATELGRLTDGWSLISIGQLSGTGAITMNSNTWLDPLFVQSGAGLITVAGAQNMGANALTFSTFSDIAINAALNGTGTLTLQPGWTNVTVGIAGGAGTFNLSTSDLNNIANGWSDIIIGRVDHNAATTINAYTWNDNVTFKAGGGGITVAGAQSANANNLTFITNSDIALNAALTGTGTLTISHSPVNGTATTYGLGGAAGTINLDATELGRITNGWGGITIGDISGTGAMTVNAATWNDNLTLRTGSGLITFNGAQTMGANNLTLYSSLGPALNADLNGTGVFTFYPNSGIASICFACTGSTINFSAADLDHIKMTHFAVLAEANPTTLNFGAYSGWSAGNQTFSTAGVVNINAANNFNAGNVYWYLQNDMRINASLAGSGSLIFRPSGNTVTQSIGVAGSGLELLTTDLANITDGWSSINFSTGGAAVTAGITLAGSLTWLDPVIIDTFNSAATVTINGTQNFGSNAFTINTDSDIALNGTVTGSGLLTIAPKTVSTTIGLGGAAGTVNLTSAELGRITNGWGGISIGSTTMTGALTVDAATWQDGLTLQSSTGIISINGAQNMGTNSLNFYTDGDLAINADLIGTASVGIYKTLGAHIGLGDGASGDLLLTNAELDHFIDGWSQISFFSGNADIRAYTWRDNTVFTSGGGVITINGTQNLGANNLTIATDANPVFNADIIGTGSLLIRGNSAGTTMGLAGGAGTLNLTAAELDRIIDGWNLITFGQTSMSGAINLGAYTWRDNLRFLSGGSGITISGDQNMGANGLALNVLTLALNANLTGTGTLTLAPTTVGTTVGLAGAVGQYNLDAAELDRITDGWSSIVVGSSSGSAAILLDAYSWRDALTVMSGTGAITVNGAQNMGANNLSIISNADPTFNAALTGTGTLNLRTTGAATTIGVAGGAGTYNLSVADLNNITNGWGLINIGDTSGGATLTANAYTWNDNLRYWTAGGIITINGEQNMGANNLTIRADSDPAINAALTGTGTLTFEGSVPATFIGLAGASGTTLNLSVAELDRITDGWTNIVIGRADQTVSTNLNAYSNWRDNLTLLTGTGAINILQDQNLNSNNLTFLTDANPNITGNLAGTGTLTFAPGSTGTTIGVGGAAGTLNLTAAEISRFVNGWSSIVVGRSDGSAGINIGTSVWADPVTFLTAGNLNLSGALSSTQTGTGTTLTLASTAGNFINTGSIDPGTGRFLIYSANPGLDTLGGLTSDFRRFSCVYGGSCPSLPATGDGLLYSITPTITVSVVDPGFVYGDAAPSSYTFSATGYLGSDGADDILTGTGLVSSTYLSSMNAGTAYSLDYLSGLTSSYGYAITAGATTNGTVGKATVTATADDASRDYGDANPAFTVSYSGFRNGDDYLDLDSLASANSAATAASNAGTYSIISSGGSDNNYIFNHVNGTLTVDKVTLTATADDASRDYGDANPGFTISYTGFKNGDDELDLDTLATASSTANLTSNAGTYTILSSGGSDTNYIFSNVNGTLTVDKATLTVTADDASREYGDANPALTVSYSGFRNGDDDLDLDSLAGASSTATTTTGVGTYGIISAGGTDNNYVFAYVNGDLTIVKATLTATADNKTRDYNDPNPPLTVSYTGFKNGENFGVINTLANASTTATGGSLAGPYTISVGGALDDNYDFSYVSGTLTVTGGPYVPPPAPPTSTLPSAAEQPITAPQILVTNLETPMAASQNANNPAFSYGIPLSLTLNTGSYFSVAGLNLSIDQALQTEFNLSDYYMTPSSETEH